MKFIAVGISIVRVLLPIFGAIALLHVGAGILPGWQIAILERSVFFVPLFIFLSEVVLLSTNAHPEKWTDAVPIIIPFLCTILLSWHQFPHDWAAMTIAITTPFVVSIGILWFWLGLIAPLLVALNERTFSSMKSLGLWILMFAMFSIPSVGMGAALLTYLWRTWSHVNAPLITSLFVVAILAESIANTWKYLPGIGTKNGYSS